MQVNSRIIVHHSKMIIIFLWLFSSSFWIAYFPMILLMLSGLVNTCWQKRRHQSLWRLSSTIWFGITLVVSYYSTIFVYQDSNVYLFKSFTQGLYMTFFTGIGMLPLAVASYIDTQRSKS
ncbi:MAG: hypothetical protein COA79_12970 [Planctomycetota bacterium]|nr:MAG: hypothetical protein COA79_12970 [Planctomycetota bacterium]